MELYSNHGAVPSVFSPFPEMPSPNFSTNSLSIMQANTNPAAPAGQNVGLCCHCGRGTDRQCILVLQPTYFSQDSRTIHTTSSVCSAISTSAPTVTGHIPRLTSRISSICLIAKSHEVLELLRRIVQNANIHPTPGYLAMIANLVFVLTVYRRVAIYWQIILMESLP